MPDKDSNDQNEVLSSKWQLQWRLQWGKAKNPRSAMLYMDLQLLPASDFEEKLGDVWIEPGDVAVYMDGVERRSITLRPDVLRKSKSYMYTLIPYSSAVSLNEFHEQIAVEVNFVVVKNTFEVIEEVNVQPSTLLDNFRALLALSEEEKKEKMCDMSIKVIEKENKGPPLACFYAHKAILAIRSPVFAKMFSHDMKETTTDSIELCDIEPVVLKELLTYIYTGVSPNIKDHAAALLYHAEKYQLGHLKSLCEQRLSYDLQTDNATRILLLADACDAQQLKRNTLLFMGKHGSVRMATEWDEVKDNAELLHDLVTTMYEQAGIQYN